METWKQVLRKNGGKELAKAWWKKIKNKAKKEEVKGG